MIVGKFIGTNSCGLKNGNTYILKISIKRFCGGILYILTRY